MPFPAPQGSIARLLSGPSHLAPPPTPPPGPTHRVLSSDWLLLPPGEAQPSGKVPPRICPAHFLWVAGLPSRLLPWMLYYQAHLSIPRPHREPLLAAPHLLDLPPPARPRPLRSDSRWVPIPDRPRPAPGSSSCGSPRPQDHAHLQIPTVTMAPPP